MALVCSLYGGISFTGGYGYVLPNPLICRDNEAGKSNPLRLTHAMKRNPLDTCTRFAS
jgi:hypothetical protein